MTITAKRAGRILVWPTDEIALASVGRRRKRWGLGNEPIPDTDGDENTDGDDEEAED